MEKKVVVMSGADVAEMRKACKEAEAAYFEAKVGALEFAAQEMRTTGREYSLSELASLTGLSSYELSAQLTWHCKAAQCAGIGRYDVCRGKRITERKFVEITENGEINPNHVISIAKKETVYYTPSKRR